MAERAFAVWLSISALARDEGADVAVRHAVSACAAAIGADAAISMSAGRGPRELVHATGAASGMLEELQVTLGQGPSEDAFHGAGPALVADLAASEETARWPRFAPAALAQGVAAIFAIPVSSGAAQVGVLSLYRDEQGALGREQTDMVLLYADAALMLALDDLGGLAPGAVELVGPGFTERRAAVHQAAGMISVQLGVPLTGGLVALRARAHADGRPISHVAADVVARRLSLAAGADSGWAHTIGRGGRRAPGPPPAPGGDQKWERP